MYEGNPPLSDTTVFSASDHTRTKYIDARVIAVDGKETSCVQAGCPYWVRVLPGVHTFRVRYTTDLGFGGYKEIVSRVATVNIEIEDMRPMHVYEARYRESSDKQTLHSGFVDLGERPAKGGLWLGQKGINLQYYPVSFD